MTGSVRPEARRDRDDPEVLDAAEQEIVRADLGKDTIDMKGSPLSAQGDCTNFSGVMSLVVPAEDDVCLTAREACGNTTNRDGERYDALLHTQPRGAIATWPAP